jgi:hypothetical protein
MMVAVEEGVEINNTTAKGDFGGGLRNINEFNLFRTGVVCCWNIVVF